MNNDKLKFRVWNNATKSYVECNDDEELFLSAQGELFCYDKKTGRMMGAFHCDIERCTGSCDKNGNLIYKNDRIEVRNQTGIIRFGFYPQAHEHFPDSTYGFYIEWDSDCQFRQDFGYWVEDMEIIGNIHTRRQ